MWFCSNWVFFALQIVFVLLLCVPTFNIIIKFYRRDVAFEIVVLFPYPVVIGKLTLLDISLVRTAITLVFWNKSSAYRSFQGIHVLEYSSRK